MVSREYLPAPTAVPNDGVGLSGTPANAYVLVSDRFLAPPVVGHVPSSYYDHEQPTRPPLAPRARANFRTDRGYGGRDSSFVGGYRGGTATASADDLRRGGPPSSITTTHAPTRGTRRDRGRPSSLALTPRPLALNSRGSPSSPRAASDGSWPPLPRAARHASAVGLDQTDSLDLDLDLGSPYSLDQKVVITPLTSLPGRPCVAHKFNHEASAGASVG